jgi:hypothetical protein
MHVMRAGPHTSPLLNTPRLNRRWRLAATGLPSPVPASRAPFRVALLLSSSPSVQTQVWRQADVAAKKLCTMAGFLAIRCIKGGSDCRAKTSAEALHSTS